MATLNVSNITQTTINWNISGLSSSWNTTNYIKAAIGGGGTITNGQSSAPSTYTSIDAPSSGSSTTTQTGSDSGYIHGSTVTIYGYIQAANSLWYNAGSATFTLQSPPLPSAPTLNSVSGSSSGFSASWTNGANTNYCKVWLQGYGTYSASAGSTSLFTSISLLPATYFVQIIPINSQGEGTYSNTLSFVVSVPPPSGLTGLTATGNNGYVHLSWNPSSGATSYDISWSGGSSGSSSTPNTTSDVMGLINGALYTFIVTPRNSGGTGSPQQKTAMPNNRPTNFSWTYSTISSGSNAIVDYRDWNGLSSKINAFRLYKNLGTTTFTQITSSTGSITASLFNELVNGASSLMPYMTNNLMPSTKSIGNVFYASYLTNIVTSINSIP